MSKRRAFFLLLLVMGTVIVTMLTKSLHLMHKSRNKNVTASIFKIRVKHLNFAGQGRATLTDPRKLIKNNKPLPKITKNNKTASSMTPLIPASRKSSSVPQTYRKKYLIYRCSGGIGTSFCSGLGNREIGIVASYLLANATNRTFGIIMTHPCQVTKFLVPNTYNWIIPPESTKNLTSRALHVRNNRKFTNSLMRIDFNKNYTEDVVYIRGNQEYHKQLLQNNLYKTNLKWMLHLPTKKIYYTVMRMLFKLHPDVQKKKDAFFKRARPSAKSKVMCAQIRMGKNPTIPWDNRPMNSLKNLVNIWDFFDKRDNKSKVFVTSDSTKVITNAKKRFGPRFITTEGPIIHIDKAYRGSVCAGMEKLILDQMILVDCDTLVVTASIFKIRVKHLNFAGQGRATLTDPRKLIKNNKPLPKITKNNKTASSMTPLIPASRKSSSVPQTYRKKYLIYRCSGGIGTSFCSGLGNREIGIVASYLLANATNRTFGIIMTHPCQVTKFLVPNTYNWMIPPESTKNLTSRALHVRNNRKFTNSLMRIDFNKNYTEDVVYIRGNQEYHKQLLQNNLYKTNLKWMLHLPTKKIYYTVMRMLFKLHPDVQKKKDAFFKRARPSAKSKVMCAQIRMGKNPTIPWDNRPMNSLKNLVNIWDFFDKRDNKSKVFVTSDSTKVITNAKKRFGPRFITTEGPIIHIDKAYRGSVCAGMEKLILDQMILVDCDTLVVSSSSFGRIPFYMRNKRGGFVFLKGKVV